MRRGSRETGAWRARLAWHRRSELSTSTWRSWRPAMMCDARRSAGSRRSTPGTEPGLAAIGPDDPVLIVGTGLTMVDLVLSLHRRGASWRDHGGVLSRPRPDDTHGALRAVVPDREDAVPLGAPVSALARWLRENTRFAEAEGGDWRGAVDALRPHTRALWQAMSIEQRRRFLRHARPWWDVHRHRMAPAVSEVIGNLRREGQLQILAGRIESATHSDGAIEVAVRRRGAASADTLTVGHVIAATGSPDGPHRSHDPLIRALLRDGVARPDPLGISLDVTNAGAVIDATGRASQRLFAIGPPSRAAFWEMIAIPDIRDQCAELATAAGDAAWGLLLRSRSARDVSRARRSSLALPPRSASSLAGSRRGGHASD